MKFRIIRNTEMRLPSLLLLSCMFLSYVPKMTLSQDIPTFTPSSAVLFPGQQVEFMCNTTADAFVWIINNDNFFGNQLQPEDGVFAINTTLFINMSMNATLYGCGSIMGNTITSSEKSILFVAAAPNQVPDVAVMPDTITLDGNNATLTLSWGEPFNNFDPIVNYTVSCSGDVTCPPNFTTTDNITRSYTITNLTSIINYTFSVVATNSIGSGEAGVLNITAPSLPGNVTGVMLICEVMDQANQCTVEWDPVIVGNRPLEQPLVYEVYYNGTTINVTSPTTMLRFLAPSLPDGVFADNITVMVTAINRFGRGTPSDSDSVEIMSSSVTDALTIITPENATSETYNITVTCTIHRDSDADVCEVLATANGQALTGTAIVTNGMATVIINGSCGVTYNITAGGTYNEELVGPRSSHGTVMGLCPNTPTIVPTTSITATPTSSVTPPPPTLLPPDTGEVTDDDNTGPIVGGIVGGIVAAIIIIIIIIVIVYFYMRKKEKSSRPTSPGEKVGFRPVSGVKVQTLDRYGKPVPMEGDNTDTGVELTGYTSKSPELTVTQIPSSTVTSTGQSTTFQGNDYQTDEKTRTPSAFMPEGSYDTLAPADEPPAPSAQVIPPAQNGQSNPNAPKLNYAELEQFTRKPASVKKPDPQPASQYAVIDPKSLQQGTYT